jgi:hypothetical protein
VETTKIFSQKMGHEKKDHGEAEVFLERLEIGGPPIDISTDYTGNPEEGVGEGSGFLPGRTASSSFRSPLFLYSLLGLFLFSGISNNLWAEE